MATFAYLEGQHTGLERTEVFKAIRQGEVQILIGTKILDEGVDLPSVGCVIIAGAGRARHVTLQRTGRGLRPYEGKERLDVYDFYDGHGKRLEAQSRARRHTYQDTEGIDFTQLKYDSINSILKGDDDGEDKEE